MNAFSPQRLATAFLSMILAVTTPTVATAVPDAAADSPDAVLGISAVPLTGKASSPTQTAAAPDAVRQPAVKGGEAGPKSAASDSATLTDQFKISYELLLKADEAREKSRWTEAARFYEDALSAYRKLVEKFPEWQPGVGRFRIAYCENMVQEMLKKAGRPLEDNESPAPTPASAEATPIPATESRPPLTVSDVIATARGFLQEGKSQEARDILLDGLRKDPDNRAVRLLIAVTQCQLGNFTDAIHVLEPLIEEQPADAHAHVAFGAACLGLGRLEDARREMNLALTHNPQMSQAHYNLAQIHLLLSPPDLDAARQHYRKSLDLGAPADKVLESRIQIPASPPPNGLAPDPAPGGPTPIED